MKSKFPTNQTSRLVPTKHEKMQIKSETGSVLENQSKRRLLRNIALTTPVVLAVSSKPALAVDCTGSIMLSGNLSNHNCTPVVQDTTSEDETYTATAAPAEKEKKVRPNRWDTFKDRKKRN